MMGVQGSGEVIAKILRRAIPSHPLAVPPVPGAFGTWQVRRHRAVPIGNVNMRSLDGRHAFDAYAHCRDDNGGRPWLRTFDTLNSAVAWMIQHEDQIGRSATGTIPSSSNGRLEVFRHQVKRIVKRPPMAWWTAVVPHTVVSDWFPH